MRNAKFVRAANSETKKGSDTSINLNGTEEKVMNDKKIISINKCKRVNKCKEGKQQDERPKKIK